MSQKIANLSEDPSDRSLTGLITAADERARRQIRALLPAMMTLRRMLSSGAPSPGQGNDHAPRRTLLTAGFSRAAELLLAVTTDHTLLAMQGGLEQPDRGLRSRLDRLRIHATEDAAQLVLAARAAGDAVPAVPQTVLADELSETVTRLRVPLSAKMGDLTQLVQTEDELAQRCRHLLDALARADERNLPLHRLLGPQLSGLSSDLRHIGDRAAAASEKLHDIAQELARQIGPREAADPMITLTQVITQLHTTKALSAAIQEIARQETAQSERAGTEALQTLKALRSELDDLPRAVCGSRMPHAASLHDIHAAILALGEAARLTGVAARQEGANFARAAEISADISFTEEADTANQAYCWLHELYTTEAERTVHDAAIQELRGSASA